MMRNRIVCLFIVGAFLTACGGGSGSTSVASDGAEPQLNGDPEDPIPEDPIPEDPSENLARFDSYITHGFDTVFDEANWAQEEQLQNWR